MWYRIVDCFLLSAELLTVTHRVRLKLMEKRLNFTEWHSFCIPVYCLSFWEKNQTSAFYVKYFVSFFQLSHPFHYIKQHIDGDYFILWNCAKKEKIDFSIASASCEIFGSDAVLLQILFDITYCIRCYTVYSFLYGNFFPELDCVVE